MKSKIKHNAFCLLYHRGQRRFLTRPFRLPQQPLRGRQWRLPQQHLYCRESCRPPKLASYHRAPHRLSWHQWFQSVTEGGRRVIRQDTVRGFTCTKNLISTGGGVRALNPRLEGQAYSQFRTELIGDWHGQSQHMQRLYHITRLIDDYIIREFYEF